jgi:hypothetical protein
VIQPSVAAVGQGHFSGPRLVLDGTEPPGRDAWLATRTPEAAAFAQGLHEHQRLERMGRLGE